MNEARGVGRITRVLTVVRSADWLKSSKWLMDPSNDAAHEAVGVVPRPDVVIRVSGLKRLGRGMLLRSL